MAETASSGAIRAGASFIEVGIKDANLVAGLKSAQAKLKEFGASVATIGAGFGALGAAITTPMIAAAKSFAEGAANLVHMSDRTGVSVEALSKLGYAASQSGADLETVEGAVRKMQKSLTAGSLENEKAEQTFRNLGLSVEQLSSLKPEEQFNTIAETIAKIPDASRRAGAAMMIFGKTGTNILPMIENMAGLTKEAEEFGLVASTEGAEGGLKLEHALTLMDKVITSIYKKIGADVAPLITDMAYAFARSAKSVKDFVAENGPLVTQLFEVGAALTAVGSAFALVGGAFVVSGTVIGGVATTLGAVGAALAALLSPLGLVIAGLATLGTWFVTSSDQGLDAFNKLKSGFMDLKTEAQNAFGGISDALKAGDIKLAAEIMWVALKLEWKKGISALTTAFNNFGADLIKTFLEIKDTITKDFVDMIAGIKASVAITKGVIDAVKATIGGATEVGRLQNALRQRQEILFSAKQSGKLTDKQFQEARAVNEEIFGKAIKDAELRAGGGIVASFLGTKEKLAKTEEERLGSQGAVEKFSKERAKQDAKDKSDAAKEIADLEEQLAGLKETAAEEAGKVKPFEEKKGGKEGEEKGKELEPGKLDEALEKSKKAVDVKGTFAASALKGFGVGDALGEAVKEHTKEVKKSNEKLDKIEKNTQKGQAVFEI